MWTGTSSLPQRDNALNPCSCLESAKSTIFTPSVFRDWVNPTAWAYRNKSLLNQEEEWTSKSEQGESWSRYFHQLHWGALVEWVNPSAMCLHHKKSLLSEAIPRESPGSSEDREPFWGKKNGNKDPSPGMNSIRKVILRSEPVCRE